MEQYLVVFHGIFWLGYRGVWVLSLLTGGNDNLGRSSCAKTWRDCVLIVAVCLSGGSALGADGGFFFFFDSTCEDGATTSVAEITMSREGCCSGSVLCGLLWVLTDDSDGPPFLYLLEL